MKKFLKQIRQKREELGNEIIRYLVYNMRDCGQRYVLEEEYSIKYEIGDNADFVRDFSIWWDYGYTNVEEFISEKSIPPLYHYYLWQGYCLYPKKEEEKEEHIVEKEEIPPLKEILQEEGIPSEPTSYIDASPSLQDNEYFNSLLESLKTIVSYQKELERRFNQTSDNLLNENPFQSDWDKLEKEFIDYYVEFALNGQENPLSYYGIQYDKEILDIFYSLHDFKEQISKNFKNLYSEYFDLWKDLSQVKQIDKIELWRIICMLEKTEDLQKTILELLEHDGIYFICAIPYLHNLDHRAFCIFTFNAIFDHQLEYQKEITSSTKPFIHAWNQGCLLSDIEGGIFMLEDKVHLIEMFGIDPNFQCKDGMTIFEKYFMFYNLDGRKFFDPELKLLKILLKFDFNLFLKNHSGMNVLELAYKYCSDQDVLMLINEVYGIQIDKTKLEFENELSLSRKKLNCI